MPLLIDGHNVIGAEVLDDIRLSDEDDEARFVERVRAWQSRYGGKITVMFDRGITEGRSALLSNAGVEVRFARNPVEADDLIRRRLRLRPQGLVLVTNDVTLRQEAERHSVAVWGAHEFIQRMMAPLKRDPTRDELRNAHGLPSHEVDAWLRIFQQSKRAEDDPIWSPPFTRPKRRRPTKTAPPPKPEGNEVKRKKHGKRKR